VIIKREWGECPNSTAPNDGTLVHHYNHRRNGSWQNIRITILPVQKSLEFRCPLEKINVVMITFRDTKTIIHMVFMKVEMIINSDCCIRILERL
jgi:hypothetical protein